MIVKNNIPTAIVALETFSRGTLQEAAEFLRDRMKESIIRQTNSSWPSLSYITLMKKFPETRKLYHKGKLVEAIKAKVHAREATIGVHPEEPRHEIGIHNEYGAPRAGIPARSFVRSTWVKYQLVVINMIKAGFVKKMKVGK